MRNDALHGEHRGDPVQIRYIGPDTLEGKHPAGEVLKDRIIEPVEAVTAQGAAILEVLDVRGHVPDMTGWTKAERSAWILEGKTPDRAMNAKKAGAQV